MFEADFSAVYMYYKFIAHVIKSLQIKPEGNVHINLRRQCDQQECSFDDLILILFIYSNFDDLILIMLIYFNFVHLVQIIIFYCDFVDFILIMIIYSNFDDLILIMIIYFNLVLFLTIKIFGCPSLPCCCHPPGDMLTLRLRRR